MKIVFATANPHKVEEVNAICKDTNVEFILPKEGFNPVEDGDSFFANALIKAKEAYKLSGMMTLADDSGLCVDALDGSPGLYSARYAGTQDEKIQKILSNLEGVENRSAKFVCAMALLDENGDLIFSTIGECKGTIALEPKGEHGFGYDPVFVPENLEFTMAQLSEDEKNKISHRANALKKVTDFLSSN